MSRTTRWEYATITHESGRDTFQIDYSASSQVDVEHSPAGAFVFTLGELGGKGWELVSATASWRGEGVYATVLYFKRQRDDDRGLRE